MNSFRRSFYAGIFLIAASTLLLEITFTKIFSVIQFHYFAFLIVSTALFGYGFSGVFLSVSRWQEKFSRSSVLFSGSLLFAITTVVAYRLILLIPLKITQLLEPQQLLFLAIVYLLLALPFFFSGLVIGVLLSHYTDHINKLYFADLTGAGLGCFAIVLIIPLAGGSGTLLVAAAIAALSALLFASTPARKAAAVAAVLAIAALVPGAEKYFPITEKSEKRYFRESIQKGTHFYSGWSPASRIDVVGIAPDIRVIWMDGGTNQSFMRRWKKNERFSKETRGLIQKHEVLAYEMVDTPSVMIIGPGGGTEVALALSYNPRFVTAVELDPLISDIVVGEFSRFIGHIYKRPNVRFVNEEGRSYIRRSRELYDIIQQKNNSHPMAVASGALNLTETYLLTKEAFHEYLDHLKTDGFLIIERQGGLRLLNLAVEVLRERGVQDYSKRLVLLGEERIRQLFLLKNGAFTERQLDRVEQFSQNRQLKQMYTPRIFGKVDSVFTRLMDENQRRDVLRNAPFELEAPTDDKPFMEHFFKLSSLWSSDLKQRLKDPFWDNADLTFFVTGHATYSDLSLYVILLEAILLSSVFIIYPLFKMKRSGVATRGAANLITYYFCLGVGFIFVEIVLIQKYILFIGYPVYAVAAIIFSLLIAAGAGSFFSGRFASDPLRAMRFVVLAVCALMLVQIFLVPLLFRQFLSATFAARLALSIAFLLPVGFFMGMPFPVGLSWTSKHYPSFVPWAWGINGYATVIGSVLSVILALQLGFRAVLFIAVGIYVLAYFVLRRAALQARVPAEPKAMQVQPT